MATRSRRGRRLATAGSRTCRTARDHLVLGSADLARGAARPRDDSAAARARQPPVYNRSRSAAVTANAIGRVQFETTKQGRHDFMPYACSSTKRGGMEGSIATTRRADP